MQLLRFSVLPGSAEAQVIWCGIVKCLLIAYFIGNISANNISKSVHMCQSYSKPKAGRFLRHGVELPDELNEQVSVVCSTTVQTYKFYVKYPQTRAAADKNVLYTQRWIALHPLQEIISSTCVNLNKHTLKHASTCRRIAITRYIKMSVSQRTLADKYKSNSNEKLLNKSTLDTHTWAYIKLVCH